VAEGVKIGKADENPALQSLCGDCAGQNEDKNSRPVVNPLKRDKVEAGQPR
jgi:hypothetical protein